jgi:hypothetical protein
VGARYGESIEGAAMKKANFVLFAGLLAAPVFLCGQTNNSTLPGPIGADSTGPRRPSADAQARDANGSLPAKAAAEGDLARQAEQKTFEREAGATRPLLTSEAARGANSVSAAEAAVTTTATGEHSPNRDLATMDATTLTQRIRGMTTSDRAEVLREVSARLAAGEKDLTNVRDVSTGLVGEARRNFGVAISEVKARQKSVRKAIPAAASAPADRWPALRSTLANEFEAYSTALSRAQSLSAINP